MLPKACNQLLPKQKELKNINPLLTKLFPCLGQTIFKFEKSNLIFTISCKWGSVTITYLHSIPVIKICMWKNLWRKFWKQLPEVRADSTYIQCDFGIRTWIFPSFVAEYPCKCNLLLKVIWRPTGCLFAVNTWSYIIAPPSTLPQI